MLILDALFDYIIKVIKLVNNIWKVSNLMFTTYYLYYKKKLGIIRSVYDLFFFLVVNWSAILL